MTADRGAGRRSPPPTSIPRGRGMASAVYERRIANWLIALAAEPRPDLWYFPDDEVRQYQAWRDQLPPRA